MKRNIVLFIAIIMLLSVVNVLALAAPPVIDTPAPPRDFMVTPAPSVRTDENSWDAAYKQYLEDYDEYVNSLVNGTPQPIYNDAYTDVQQHQSAITDITGHWAENSILYCYDQGLINVYGDNTVRPNAAITRGEFAFSLDRWITKNEVLLNELEFSYTQNSVSFDDVKYDDQFNQNILSIASKGIMSGSSSLFRPNESLTRQEAGTVWVSLFKMLNNCTIDKDYIFKLNTDSILSRYTDQNDITAWARESVAVMTDQKFIHGYPNNSFKPDGSITRAEACSILANIELHLKNSAKEVKSTPESSRSDDIKLIRMYAKNVSSYGFDIQITVNDIAVNKNVDVVIAYTTNDSLGVTESNISSLSGLTTRTVKLNTLTRVETFAYQSIYSTHISASFPNCYYVYAMLKTVSTNSDIKNCVIRVDRETRYDTVYVDRPVYYTSTPAPEPSPSYTSYPTLTPTPIPWDTSTPIPTSLATATPTPTTTSSALPTSTPTATTAPSMIPTSTPMTITSESTRISCGSGTYSLAIDESGGLWIWSSSGYRLLGNSVTFEGTVPDKIKIMDNAKAVSAGSSHSLSIDKNGCLWAWGANDKGQLGNGLYKSLDMDNLDSYTPPEIVMNNVEAISAGYAFSLAIDKDGSLWAWGENNYGQLGNGSNVSSSSKTKVMEDVAAVSAGGFHSLAIDKDGNLFAWGRNQYGQLGIDNGTENTDTPTQVMNNVKFKAISANFNHSLAIDEDGGLWAWGWNLSGELGDGTLTQRNIPVKVPINIKVKTISAGISHSIAIDEDGNMWAWGSNQFGQFGNGTNNPSFIPLKVMSSVKVNEISSGNGDSLAIDVNGKYWAWGSNTNGQLGDGTVYDRNVPVQIFLR